MILEATLLSLEKWQYNMIVRSSNSSSGNSSSCSSSVLVVAVVVVVVGVVVVIIFLRAFVNKNRVYIHTYIYICIPSVHLNTQRIFHCNIYLCVYKYMARI